MVRPSPVANVAAHLEKIPFGVPKTDELIGQVLSKPRGDIKEVGNLASTINIEGISVFAVYAIPFGAKALCSVPVIYG